jgi:hypothetical protein
MRAACAADTLPKALFNPAIHPWETAHTLWSKNNIKSAAKILAVATAAIKCLEYAFSSLPNMSTFKSTCDTVNLTSKICVDTEGLAYSCVDKENNLFQPGKEKKGLANTTGIDCKYQIPYILKISALAIGTLTQTWIAVEKLFVPQLAAVSEAFVAHTAKIAFAIGGTNMETAARCVTSVGLSTVKNVSLLLFLTIDCYQWYTRAKEEVNKGNETNIFKAVLNQIKTIEGLSKIAVISLALFGAPLPLVLAAGLIAAYLSIASECQKALPEPEKAPAPEMSPVPA